MNAVLSMILFSFLIPTFAFVTLMTAYDQLMRGVSEKIEDFFECIKVPAFVAIFGTYFYFIATFVL